MLFILHAPPFLTMAFTPPSFLLSFTPSLLIFSVKFNVSLFFFTVPHCSLKTANLLQERK